MNEIWNVLEEAYIPGGEGTEGKTTQNVTIGGVNEEGKDATTDLTWLALTAYADVRTVQPNMSARFSPDTPDDFLNLAVEYARDGVLLHFMNDEVVIDALVKAGHTLADARDYGVWWAAWNPMPRARVFVPPLPCSSAASSAWNSPCTTAWTIFSGTSPASKPEIRKTSLPLNNFGRPTTSS